MSKKQTSLIIVLAIIWFCTLPMNINWFNKNRISSIEDFPEIIKGNKSMDCLLLKDNPEKEILCIYQIPGVSDNIEMYSIQKYPGKTFNVNKVTIIGGTILTRSLIKSDIEASEGVIEIK